MHDLVVHLVDVIWKKKKMLHDGAVVFVDNCGGAVYQNNIIFKDIGRLVNEFD
jgi:hypothetical protein